MKSSSKKVFKDFINFYNKEYYSKKIMNNLSKGPWNPKRQDYLKQYNNNRKSFLSEIEEIEAHSISDLVPEEFFSDKKTKNIFSNFLQDLSQEISKNKNSLLTIDSCSMIAEEKEEYEMIKRNLNKYIDYFMDKNFYLMKYYSKNVNLFYLKIEDSLVKIQLMKKRMKFIKKHYFIINAKVHLKQQKLKNCKNIYSNLLKIREFKNMYLSINSKKNSINYQFPKKNSENKSKFNKTGELIKRIEHFKYYNKSLICFWFIQNLKINQNDFKDNYEELLSKLFLTKLPLDEFTSLYDIFLSLNTKIKNVKEINNELLNKLIIFYKKDIFNMFKGILLSYATIDYAETMNSNKIFKLKQLQELSFEERKLFLSINQICITILSFCDNFNSYLFDKEYRNTRLGQILFINRKTFYDIINKKLRKILFLYTDLILNFQNESNIYLILSSFSLAYAYIEKTFFVEDNSSQTINLINQNQKNINNKNNNLIKSITINNNNKIIKKNKINLNLNNKNNNENNNNNISNNNNNILKNELYNFYTKLTLFLLKQKIKNLCLYLGKDSWKKINILNLNEQLNKRNIKVIKYKDFLSLPFKIISIDKTEIKKQLANLLNFKEAKNIKINLNNLFNKKINERNLVFSSSSFNLFQYILDIYAFSLMIPSLKSTIFKFIFNLYDYYLYSTIYMFHKDKLNLKEIKRKDYFKNINSMTYEELINKSKETDYIHNYANLISFLLECKKEVLLKIVGNEQAFFTILPLLSSQIVIMNNQDNNKNINVDNFIEKIICFESCWSIFKIIKRMLPSKKNNYQNDIHFIQINRYKIILNEIRHFIYYPISSNLIKNNSYIISFINNNWLINLNNKNNNKVNTYIEIMVENIKDVKEKLTMFLPISLKARIRFIYIFLIFMVDKIKESIDKIKDINKSTLNIIISDFKLFNNKLKNIIISNDNGNEINNKTKVNLFDTIFNYFFEYLNNIIINKEKFVNNVMKNKIPLFMVNKLLNMNKYITNNERNKIQSDLRCNFLKEMQIINDIFLKYN